MATILGIIVDYMYCVGYALINPSLMLPYLFIIILVMLDVRLIINRQDIIEKTLDNA